MAVTTPIAEENLAVGKEPGAPTGFRAPILAPKKTLWRLAGEILARGGPGYLQFAITNVCNARCDFCGFAADKFDPRQRRAVTLEQARDVIDISGQKPYRPPSLCRGRTAAFIKTCAR